MILNSNVMSINTATASTGNGGVFHFENTGSTTMSLTTPSFSTCTAAGSGGIGSFAGTAVSITATGFTVDTCEATTGNGGCFYYGNTGSSTIDISTGSITTKAKA